MTAASVPRVAAVVLHYDEPECAASCVRTLHEQSLRPHRVVVVDNASSAERRATLRELVRDAEVIELPANRGYAAGMNAGVSTVARDAEYVLLCTHDAQLGADAVRAMVDTMAADPGLGVVGPLLAQADLPDRVWSAGGTLRTITGRPQHKRGSGSVAAERRRGPRACCWLDGAVLLTTPGVLASVGPFDEAFFLYCEEVDWQLRCAAAGYRVADVTEAVATQRPGLAPPYLQTRNRILLYRRRRRRWYLLAAVLSGVHAAFRAVLKRKWRLAGLRVKAVRDGFTERLDADWGFGRQVQRSAVSTPPVVAGCRTVPSHAPAPVLRPPTADRRCPATRPPHPPYRASQW